MNSDRKIKFKVIGSIDFIHSCYPCDVIATVCRNSCQCLPRPSPPMRASLRWSTYCYCCCFYYYCYCCCCCCVVTYRSRWHHHRHHTIIVVAPSTAVAAAVYCRTIVANSIPYFHSVHSTRFEALTRTHTQNVSHSFIHARIAGLLRNYMHCYCFILPPRHFNSVTDIVVNFLYQYFYPFMNCSIFRGIIPHAHIFAFKSPQ